MWVQQQLGRPVVKAFSNINAYRLTVAGQPQGSAGRLALAVASDDEHAKQAVLGLVNDAGFDALDAGSLADSWRQQPGTPAYCTELTAPELTQALAAAVPGKAPVIRDQIIGQLSQRETPPSRQDILALNRSLELGAAQ